ncbi:MAG TPA: Fic family protein [Kiritimatiellia bacterium]|nr:Fic family protein [Kiritimatiellia bacterium]
MKRPIQGETVVISTVGEKAVAFVPANLPPSPPIDWTPSLRNRFDEALLALGRLDSVSLLLPDVSLFLYTYVRKEAVLSSMIEGTQSSLSDLLLFELNEAPGAPFDDVSEVSNYVAALDHGLNRLREGFPLSLRLLREMHECLLKSGRGEHKTPGEFRRSQNWIGGTRPGNAVFVPPPPERVADCMGALEKFLHDDPEPTPVLLKAALAHVQFETIHPFLDGNGRLGRLMITLLLCEAGVLKLPMLYLSLFFKTHRQAYYEFLNRVRIDGDWEIWLDFFAQAVIETATQAVQTVQRLDALARKDREAIQSLGRAAGSALQLHHELLIRPITTSRALERATGLSHVSVNKALDHLCALGMAGELTGAKRNRIFSYTEYIRILNEGTEPPGESE